MLLRPRYGREKPENQVAVDLSHPLGRHLVRCLLFNRTYGLNDLIDGCGPVSVASAPTGIALTAKGSAYKPTENTRLVWGPIGRAKTGTVWTGDTGPKPIANGFIAVGYTFLADLAWADIWWMNYPTNTEQLGLGLSNTTDVSVTGYLGGDYPSCGSAIYQDIPLNTRLDVALSLSSNAPKDAFKNGAFFDSIYWSGTSVTWYGNFDIGGGYTPSGAFHYAYVFDVLPDRETIQELQQAPYQLFARKISRSYSFAQVALVPLQYSYPDGDISATGWRAETGATTNLYASVDEETRNDADYIYAETSGSVCLLSLTPLVDPDVHTGHTIEYVLQGDGETNCRVTIYSGTTQIAQWTESAVPETETLYSHTLSEGEAATLADYTDPRIKFEAI